MKNLNSKSSNKVNNSQANQLRRVGMLLLSMVFSLAFLGLLGSFSDKVSAATTTFAHEDIFLSGNYRPVKQRTNFELLQKNTINALQSPLLPNNALTIWLADHAPNPPTALISHDGGSTIESPVSLSGGLVRANAASPFDPDTAYYITSDNKLWKTEDSGQSFNEATNFSPSGTPTDVFVNPQDPEQVWVVVDNGDNFDCNDLIPRVYRSTDGGDSWSWSEVDEFCVRKVYRGVASSDGNTLYLSGAGAGGCGGYDGIIYKSTDGGINWTRDWGANTITGCAFSDVNTFSTPLYNDTGTIYAGLYGRIGTSLHGILRKSGSNDWEYKPIEGCTGCFGTSAQVEVADVAVDAWDGDLVLALVSGNGLYRSANGGDTWTQVISEGSVNRAWRIKADPSTTDSFWLVGENVDGSGEGLFHSDDGGQTWTRVYSDDVLGSDGGSTRWGQTALSLSYPAIGATLPDESVVNENLGCDLPNHIDTQGIVGEPINPRNGNYMYMERDISLPVVGCHLQFVRAYASDTIDYYTSTLGYGWTHNYDMRLHFTNTAIPGTVEIQTPNGSRLPFYDNGDGTYTPYAGVTAELVEIGSTYVITGFNQKVYTFDAQGLLLEQADPYGNVITFTYNTSDQLIRAGQGNRYLTYGYDGSGRLTSVMDNLDREVTLEYGTHGDLITVTNALDLPTTYTYSGTTHLLTKVTDPSGTVLEETAYDNEGRAYQQWDGEGKLLVEIDYSLANTRVVTENGVVMTYTYDARNTLVGIEYACTDGTAGCQVGSSIAYDGNFKQDGVVDLNGNPTTLDWNEGGSNLEYVKDALDNETFLAYDQYNNLTQTIDARENATEYFYDNPNFPTFLTRMTNALDKTTYYTPTTTLDGVPGLLKQQEDPDGRITTYDYNEFGQIIEMVVAAGTNDAVTTAYGYDAVGRLITTTQSSVTESHTNLNVYDDGDRLVATVANWDGVLDWHNCSFVADPREENVCTLYGYDDAGRIISTTNALGQTNLTFYDGAGRTFLSVTNWDGGSYNANNPLPDLCNFSNPDPEFNLCYQTEYDAFGRVYTTTNALGHQSVNEYDSLGRVNRTVTNWQDGIFNANDADGDIETSYEYDANGNTIIVTDTVGRITRTFYDALNRVQGTITNWDGSTTLANCSSLPTMRDNNICTQYEYDEVGNTIIVTDTLGRMTRTFYDDLNRVEATVVNWQPTLTSPNSCVLSATNDALENICTLYGYDDAGNQITTTNALNQTSLTVYDSANRPFLTVRNWDSTPISSENDCSFPPAQSDTNVCSVTYFDELGRRRSSKDALGNLTDYAYDGLGRLITTTRYLENGTVPVETVIEYDALGNRLTQTDAEGNDISFLYDDLNRMETSTTEEGVTHTNYYNAAGWVTQTVDTLLHAITFDYDDLGRRLTVTDAESNVTTYEYDALGNQMAMIDAKTIRTTYEYDDLNRLERVIENDVPGSNPTNQSDVVTEYSYDALGNRVHITNALGITNTYTIYDVLNRPWIVEDALGNQTVTLYNALGYRIVMTDGNEAVTTYGYDGLNRLETINYLADGVTVEYQYDALGNRTVMTDDLGTTSYDYDELYRLTEVTDPFAATVGYGYDKVGNRTSLTYPDERVVTYTYDFDNRLETVLDWDTGTTTYEYDLAGRLITTTLPSGVVSVNIYDDANRLTNLSHTSSNDVLIASFAYEPDKVGNRTAVTETIRQPGALAGVTAFLEENGQLVLEAESGTASAGTTHTWNSQTAQSDYAGTAYMRALPDIGQQYGASATADSPGLNFTVQIDNPGTYTVWARGMTPDAAGDSLHVGINDGTPATAASLTGFAPNAWTWSRLTMSSTNATIDLSSSGVYTLNVWMAEDGLRLDKLLLVTDTATIPTGQGPLESPTTTALPPLGDQFISYGYDSLHRLTEAIYTGTFSGTYQYEFDAVGNRKTYTTTIATTEVTTYLYDDANRLTQSTVQGGDTTTYDWDSASRLITTTVANEISRVYGYSQDGDLLSALVDGQTTTFLYDGNGNRLQMAVGSEVTTYTVDYGRSFQVLLEQGGAYATTKHYLYGLACIAEEVDADEPETKEWRYYQRDGNSLVRQTTNEQEDITLAWTFSPEGAVVLGEEGPVTNLDCGNNATYDWSTGLIFKNGRYFDPRTGIWLTMGGVFVWQTQLPSQRKKSGKRKRERCFIWLLLFILILSALVGCSGTEGITETPPCTPDEITLPINTPDATLPPPVISTPTVTPPFAPTAIPTTYSPTVAPSSTPTDPLAGFELGNPFGGDYYLVCEFEANDCGMPLGNHNGVDVVPVNYADASCSGGKCLNADNPPPASELYRDVYSPVSGVIKETYGSTIKIEQIEHNLTNQVIGGLEIELTHVIISGRSVNEQVRRGDKLTEFVGEPSFPYPHLHIGMIYLGKRLNPQDFLQGHNRGYYFYTYYTLPTGI